MTTLPRLLLFAGMILLTLVSMWTTYRSLHDSILPEPIVPVRLGSLGVWECSVVALALSVAIGVMLFALKLAIIDEQKRFNALGVVGMTVVAFISIVFNMDVLYRTADREFFLRYSTARVKDTYAKYIADVQSALNEKRKTLQTALAAQEGELETEIMGLRDAPAGYGPRARQEDYRLTIMEKTTAVELAALEEAIAAQRQADEILRGDFPASIQEVEQLQDKLRVAVKEPGAAAGLPLPEPVRLDNPLFAVFSRLCDVRTIGFKEVFFLAIALFLDLGDIVGYSLIPNRGARRRATGIDVAPAGHGEHVPDLSRKREPSEPAPSPVEFSGSDSMLLEPQVRRAPRKLIRFRKY